MVNARKLDDFCELDLADPGDEGEPSIDDQPEAVERSHFLRFCSRMLNSSSRRILNRTTFGVPISSRMLAIRTFSISVNLFFTWWGVWSLYGFLTSIRHRP